MTESASGWNKQHERYAQAEWINKPSIFGEWALQYFPPQGKVLDAGCGQGQDSRLFASKGYDVTAVDFAAEALRFAAEKTPEELKGKINYRETDLSKPLVFPDGSFDVVYSHLATHYFDTATTQKLFDELYRVLKPGGTLILLVNSTTDPEIPSGTKIEDDFYQMGDMQKRFFSPDSIKKFAGKFDVVIADNEGETYKDRAVGNSHLVRLVAKKS
jgi:ubiquinone/menaquinone biosynthesis C-methylase UbiE